MTGTPYYCRPETNLGAATELMWVGNCGFLPVVSEEGKVVGVITDRDICMALGTQSRPSGEVTVAETMSKNVCFCAPEDDIRLALQSMREGRVRRLPVITKAGKLVGVVSIDEVVLRAEPLNLGRAPELSGEDVIETLQAINTRQLPQAVTARSAAA
jgi:CBS domain-containing protein